MNWTALRRWWCGGLASPLSRQGSSDLSRKVDRDGPFLLFRTFRHRRSANRLQWQGSTSRLFRLTLLRYPEGQNGLSDLDSITMPQQVRTVAETYSIHPGAVTTRQIENAVATTIEIDYRV